jgi:tRNA-dihydrouridine synthase 3
MGSLPSKPSKYLSVNYNSSPTDRTASLRYLLSYRVPEPVIDDDATECKTNHVADSTTPGGDVRDRRDDNDEDEDGDGRGNKRQRVDESGAGRKLTKDEKKARQGQNKGRRFKALKDEVQLCRDFMNTGECPFGLK